MHLDRARNPSDKISLFKEMLLIRRLEEALVSEYPKQQIRCPVHFSIGQEAIAVGTSAFLTASDWVVSNHRSHAHYIAKGGNLFAFISELYGKETGCCSGRGGSMHLTDMSAGFLSGIPIVGSALPIAAGVAMSQKWEQTAGITVVYIGDSAVESGAFHETLNLASLHNLPLLTICENNEFSVFTPLSARQPTNRTICQLAKSHGVRSFSANGDNVMEVTNVIRKARSYMTANSRPAFVEFSTYRLLEHCGPNHDDDLNYRDPSLVTNYVNRDPISILHKDLLRESIDNSNLLLEIDKRIKEYVSELIEKVQAAPNADYELKDTVYWSES